VSVAAPSACPTYDYSCFSSERKRRLVPLDTRSFQSISARSGTVNTIAPEVGIFLIRSVRVVESESIGGLTNLTGEY
jgi:hypothetical protein